MLPQRQGNRPVGRTSPRPRQFEQNTGVNRQNNVPNVIPLVFTAYDAQFNNLPPYPIFIAQNGFVFHDGQFQPPLQFNVGGLSGDNYVTNSQPLNTDGTPIGVYGVINPTPCFCDAYNQSHQNPHLDQTVCDCDVCVEICRSQPDHICLLNSPPPPLCNVCSSPRNHRFPYNCNVCYPVGIVCCNERCSFDELFRMQDVNFDHPFYRRRRP